MDSQIRLLCLSNYPLENAGVRHRMAAYFPYLRQQGVDVTFRPFLDSRFFSRFYEPGHALSKALHLTGFMLRRCADMQRAYTHDAVLIHKGAAIAGPPLFETLITKVLKKPIIFDFDDAIHVLNTSAANRRAARLLKCPGKAERNLRMSAAVIAGNEYLADFAGQLNSNVTVIPTVVDSKICRPRTTLESHADPVVLGWIGTHTTAAYLATITPALQELARRFNIVVRIVGAGAEISMPGVKVENLPWHLATELETLQSFDIGLYPIVEDDWSWGKSGFKAIQYMAVGIPSVCSPVGVIQSLVRDGMDGFTATTHDEWVARLGSLIEDPGRRRQMGLAGRTQVENWYSLDRQAPRLHQVIRSVV